MTAQWKTGFKLRVCVSRGHKHTYILASRSFMSFKQNLLEGLPEVSVEDGVYDGVQAAVAVADPEEQVEERVGDGAVLSADGVQTVREEKREPAEDEHPHHHGQNEREALLPHLSHFAFGQRRLPAAERHGRREEEVVGTVLG